MRVLLLANCVLAAATILSAADGTPQMVRVVTGVLIVFLLPGFALVSALRPNRLSSSAERLLASLGLSLSISVGATVLLAALPVGLTRSSIAIFMGTLTIALSGLALARLSTEAKERVLEK